MAKMFDTALRINAPGPRGVPMLNNIRFLSHSVWYILDRLAPLSDGPVLATTGGNGSLLLLRGEEGVRTFFTDNDSFHRGNEGVFRVPEGRPWSKLFESILTVNGEQHRRTRKLLMPITHKSAMDHYRDRFVETFKNSRFAQTDGEPFDMAAEFLRISKINLLTCLFGLEPTASNLALAGRVATLYESTFNPAVFLLPIDRPWTPYGRWTRLMAAIYRDFTELIERKRAAEPAPDALSILCHTTDEDGDFLTTAEIAGQLLGLFGAGFETVAMSMTWALLLLAATPEVRVEDEETLDAVVKEAQRLLPGVPMSLPRRIVRPVEIGESVLPEGALVFVSAILEHRDPRTFPDPQVFRPSRWADLHPSPFRYLPFGVGARRCIGSAFAELQIRTTLQLTLAEGTPSLLTTHIDYAMGNPITSRPARPVVIKMEKGPARPVAITGTIRKLWTPDPATSGTMKG